MKFILLSDIHLVDTKPIGRIDDIETEQFKKMKFIFNYAQENNCLILQAGDVLDKPKPWELLPSIIRLFKRYNIEWYGIFGQHDQYFRTSKKDSSTVFGVLSSIPFIHDISGRTININKNICITGVGWDQKIPKGNIESKCNILVIHAPIGTTALFPEHKYNDALRFLREHKTYNLILCGDIHRHFLLRDRKRAIVNTGPLLRLHADKYNFKHKPCFYVYDSIKRTLEQVIVPHQPAKKVLTREHIEKVEEAGLLLNNFIVNLRKMKKKKVLKSGLDIIYNINRYCKQYKVPKNIKRRLKKIMEE